MLAKIPRMNYTKLKWDKMVFSARKGVFVGVKKVNFDIF